ncbi:hypothetical protein [Streptomyces sp. NPDC015130]|uniref:hypothetical protein n=1 Tax=Streptomyces sp. NPDC015130 TaxID=3364940 RepID=UPI003700629A
MVENPLIPDDSWDRWPRIPIDTSEESDFAEIDRVAGFAATSWALNSRDGVLATGMSLVQAIDGAVHEALLHLLEIGFIDIDTERLHAADGYPMNRES